MVSGLKDFAYPYPVNLLPLVNDGEQLRMAYMDIAPAQANGRVVVLLHGRNFPSSYWAPEIKVLTEAGYRVVVPDQIGFGKSSKPIGRASFRQSRPQHDDAARSSRNRESRHRRAFAGRHARGADRARLPGPPQSSGAGRPDRPGRLPDVCAADADGKNPRKRGQAHRRRLSQAARDQLLAENSPRSDHAVHRRPLQHQGLPRTMRAGCAPSYPPVR